MRRLPLCKPRGELPWGDHETEKGLTRLDLTSHSGEKIAAIAALCGGLPWGDLKQKKPGIFFAEPKETSYDSLLATLKKLIPIMRLMID